ncbi:MAG: hypothetical protein KC766_36140 [Myxococcales bacterium]|nr:hypothetical protein [Myxococcales bacterium]MCA9633157.1 hypothetical protein [Myxococcales bacterium]
MPSLLTDVEDLALGSEHACALSGGEVWCWGEGGSGQLGVGIVDDTIVPVRAFVGARHLSAGQSHSCVVDTSQAIWCWGALTFGGQAFHAEPTRVPGVSGVQVTSGVGHACARASSGTVRCWGTNTQGVLGSGSYAGPDAVTTVAELNDASLVSAGDYFNCAVRAEGKVVCWGLGGGVQSAALVEVEGLDSVERLDAGGASACAIRADESLWCWGTNSFGEVGDGTTQRRVRAVRVLDSVADVSVGYSHTCAVLVDGGVRCWGTNDAGELGTGTREPVAEPADVLAP